MNVLPNILQYGGSGTSGNSGEPAPNCVDNNTPLYTYIPNSEPVDESVKVPFISKLFSNCNPNTLFTNSPVVCAANPCPVILNATCVFYEGSNLIYTGINTNDSLQVALQKIDEAVSQLQPLGNYVVTSTTLTINGITYDLSASRTWNVGTVTSVGIIMPPAFSVANSPITTSGTLTVTGAGLISQYVRGDGTLADFPGGGGGSSVKYYFNGGTNQGTFGGNTYYEMSKTAVIGTNADFSTAIDGYISQFITDAGDPALLNIPGGSWDFQMYFSASSAGGSPSFYIELYKYDGTTFTLIGSSSATPEFITGGASIDLYYTSVAVPATPLTPTDRLAVRFYVSCSGRTITLHTQDTHLCSVTTTFSTGITALNSLTEQVQYLTTGTAGTDFNILSAAATHTFNLPIASAVNTGKLSAADWTTFNNKPSGTGVNGQVTFWTGTNTQSGSGSFLFDNVNNRLSIGSSGFAGDFDIVKNNSVVINYANLNNLNNLTFGTSVFLQDIRGQRNGINSTLARMQVLYNGDGITRRGKLLFGVAEISGFGASSLVLTQTLGNSKIVIAGQGASSYLDNDVSLSTTYGLHANLIASGNTGSGALPPLSIDRDGIVQSVFFNSGNFSIGSITDSGQRLQVTGDTLLRGSGNTSASVALTIQNSASSNILRVVNDGSVYITAPTNTEDNNLLFIIYRPNGGKIITFRDRANIEIGNNNFIYPSAGDANATISRSASGLFLGQTDGTVTTGNVFNISLGRPSNINNQPTSGTDGGLAQVIGQFNPTSGTSVFASFKLAPTINQTGGANGITRGLYINPTLTSAADWRAIEVSAGITVLAPSTTASASLRLPNGVAPTTPTNGDIWSTTTDLLARINNTTYSLINSGLSGSGAAGQVTFWDSTTNITGSNNLFWDNTNSRLGVGTNVPAAPLDVRTTSGFDTAILKSQYTATVYIGNDNTWGHFATAVGGTGTRVAIATQGIRFRINNTDRATFGQTGNLMLADGVPTDSGQRLQVAGNALIVGSGNTSASTALTVNNSDGTNLFRVGNSGIATIGSASSYIAIDGTSTTKSIRLFSLGIYEAIITANVGNYYFGGNGEPINSSGGSVYAKFIYTDNIISGSNGTVYNPLYLQGGSFNNHTTASIGFASWDGGSNIQRLIIYSRTNAGVGGDIVANPNNGNFIIGTTVANRIESAQLQIDSTTKGFLPPRMTSAQRTAIVTPVEGLIVFQTDGVIGLYVYANATWRSLTMV